MLKNAAIMQRQDKESRRTGLVQSDAWLSLAEHFADIQNVHLRDLFEQDRDRFDKYSLELNDVLFDFSKNRVNDETIRRLVRLAESCDLSGWIEKMFTGEVINHTEHRAVLHTALRDRSNREILVNGDNIVPEIRHERERVKLLAEKIRSQEWIGVTGKAITDVVNIGIGGSHLGPSMVTEALKPYCSRDIKIHFVSNIDENDINDTLEYLDPETTIFIISSKTFTTQETMINASTARQWFMEKLGKDRPVDRHFVAVTSNVELAVTFGIARENIFKMWDWVGGRYSLWSSIGLPIAIAIGPDRFDELLDGAYDADQHFRHTSFDRNIPVIMALLGVWYNDFFEAQTIAILPYDQHLHAFPTYLRQLDMESNGKFVDRNGKAVDYTTGPVVFGETGNTGQHAFFQLLHQGTKLVPADFLAPIYNYRGLQNHHRAMMSNVFAQTEALMLGKTSDEVRTELQREGMSDEQINALLPYRIFPGNHPTNTFLFDTLDPKTLGTLIAFYEHKVFVQGVIWNLNSFDQWGVELGKQLAKGILSELEDDGPVSTHDSSTNGLVNRYKQRRPHH